MGKDKNRRRISPTEENLEKGIQIVQNHPLFGSLSLEYALVSREILGRTGAARVDARNRISLNRQLLLSPSQWAYVIAHCQLHHCFGHFDALCVPGYFTDGAGKEKIWKPVFQKAIWNTACDIYVAKFLADIRFGKPLCQDPAAHFPGSLQSEQAIYQYLNEHGGSLSLPYYGTASPHAMDMDGLEHPLTYPAGKSNPYVRRFAWALTNSVSHTIRQAAELPAADIKNTKSSQAAGWFISHYPLLGALAAAFRVVEDQTFCHRHSIKIAAIDMELGEIYVNPALSLSSAELHFVLAHEYLHAGLQHQKRCQGRDPYLWNIACDYVINAWLLEMGIGAMPDQGLLYDESLKELSAETIYDMLVQDLKKYSRLQNLRGYGKGEFLNRPDAGGPDAAQKGVSLDEFCRNALAQGLEFVTSSGRGTIPAGLIEEIRALAMPPIPWDVKLARWFDTYFPPLDRQRTYARPSRRQGSTPDIPRPRYIRPDLPADSRTFGVIIDTSGSMSARDIGKALGSIASYAAARDVSYARIIFCDAAACDAGYLSVEEIAGRVTVRGRGGTCLQPGVDLLEKAPDFPKDGPILLITDGWIERDLRVRRNHAFLIPQGRSLPFRAKEVFYFC